MAYKDLETIVSDIETFMKANFGSVVTKINSEKSDSITISDINTIIMSGIRTLIM